MKRALLALALCGCGYHSGEPKIADAETIAIAIARNDTLRRGNEFGIGGHEYDLTRRVRDMVLSRTDYGLTTAGDADLVAEIVILDYDTPFLVEDVNDRPLVTNVSIEVKLKVTRRDGSKVYEGTRREEGYLVGSRGEDESVAREEAYEKLSRWIVSRLQGGW